MVSSVFNIAVTGLNTAQAGLSAVSNNISNAGTKGYSRQDVVQSAASGIQTRIGYFGSGVSLDDVRRSTSSFLNTKLNESFSGENYFKAYDQQISQIDAALSDDVNGVAAGLTGFFTALQDLTTRPGDLAARESLLTAARSVSGRINGVATVVERVRDSVNNALQGATDSVNAISSQLADLNVQITDAMNRSGSGSTPNDLLDKRDMLMQELSTYVSNTVIENGDGTFNVYLRSGQPLVSKTQFSELTVLRDPYDPQNVQVGLILGAQGNNPKTVRYDEAALGQGKIAGMLGVRDTDLPQYRNIIGVIASQFAQRMNTLQREGFDLNGAPGENMFSFESGRASRSLLNESTAVAALTTVDFSKVTANDYEVFNDAGTIKYRVANTRDAFVAADVVSSGTPPVYKIGSQFEFSISGTSVTGDKFLLQPTATAASSLRVDLTGPSSIAAGRVQNAKGDNSNLQKMALLQTTPVEFSAFGASQDATLTSAFNQLVSKVGNRTREVQEALATRIAVREGAEAQQQDVSGVNLDEEAANLLKYQQAYQAAGQVIAMSKSLFDSLLNALG